MRFSRVKQYINYTFLLLFLSFTVSFSSLMAQQFGTVLRVKVSECRRTLDLSTRAEAVINLVDWLKTEVSKTEVKELRTSRSWNWEARVVNPIKELCESFVDHVADEVLLQRLLDSLEDLKNDFEPRGKALHAVTVAPTGEVCIEGLGRTTLRSPVRSEELKGSGTGESLSGESSLGLSLPEKMSLTLEDFVSEEHEEAIIDYVKRISREEHDTVEGLYDDVCAMVGRRNPILVMADRGDSPKTLEAFILRFIVELQRRQRCLDRNERTAYLADPTNKSKAEHYMTLQEALTTEWLIAIKGLEAVTRINATLQSVYDDCVRVVAELRLRHGEAEAI